MKEQLIFNSSFFLFFIMLMLISFIFYIIGIFVNAEIIISPIKGFVFGALYHDEDYTENKEHFTEYTLQALLGIISINVLWTTKNG